ncbi:hypothetical protein P167DRAFT_606075 [Morchella conica CCBAS932]|uniref:BTB domain-containing protein n=1 Tax=Morchella conica CCBAS932 TaxID=1392247 RepID=A0A3N4KU98_9PEZI|nr:hypothetical protein P167DRAFT_606075 [Morchella conica CCBAS932]
MLKCVDPQGDVVINTSAKGFSLLVSSKILSVASPVFAAMFSPHFREGNSLATAPAPITIDLLEDAPEALENICNVLHYKHDLVTVKMHFHELLEIAVVADKYDLAKSLGPWRYIWLNRVVLPECGSCDGGGWQREIFLMYVFGQASEFKSYTSMEITWLEPCYGDKGMFEPLPDRIMAAVNAARLAAMDKVLDIAETARLQYQSPGRKCNRSQGCDATLLGSIIHCYSKIGIFPPPQSPYEIFCVGHLSKSLEMIRGSLTGHQECVDLWFNEMIREVAKVMEPEDGVPGLELKAFMK